MLNLKICIAVISLTIICILKTDADPEPQKINSNKLTRIVGGSTTTIDQVKYIVFIRYRNRFNCGGSMITPTHVVTAAHCVTKRSGSIFATNELTVHGGSTYKSQDGIISKVKKITIPSTYRYRGSLTMDVAVLTLANPLIGANIETIALCTNPLPVGASVTVSGWGQTRENGLSLDQLRTIDLNMISREKCIRNYRFQAMISSSMICATRPGKDACSGDSGGPLVYNNELCGIVSWGIGCARSAYPGVYTSINKVKTFITNAINLK